MDISISKAEHQREGVLRLDVVVQEAGMTYSGVALVPNDYPDRPITLASNGHRLLPQEEVEIAVLEHLRQTEDG